MPLLWPLVFQWGNKILFAHTSFLWRNLAAHNAGVTVAVIGFGVPTDQRRLIYTEEKDGTVSVREAANINAYLVPSRDIIVEGSTQPRNGLPRMSLGNQPYEGHLLDPGGPRMQGAFGSGIDPFYKGFLRLIGVHSGWQSQMSMVD